MPKFLEQKLKTEAVKQGLRGADVNRYAYGAMNNMGAMHGNKETPKGAAMAAKHSAKGAPAPAAKHPHGNLGKWLHPAKKR